MAVVAERSDLASASVINRQSSALISLAVAAILLLAVALRAFRLTAQSLWYDEGVSAVMAPRGLVDIAVKSAADIHPPLYYYLLHFWTALAGSSELGLRWLSLIEGVLLVAAVYALGKRLGNPAAGLFGAVFAAVSPLLIYYSQEARMYSQVALLGALSFCLFIELARRTRHENHGKLSAKVCVAYLLVTVAMIYSHYYAFTILVAQNLMVLGGFARELFGRRRGVLRRLVDWIGLQAIVVVVYLPWLFITFDQLQSWPSISEAFGLTTLLEKVFAVFSLGLAADVALTPARGTVFVVLLAAVLLVPLLRDRRRCLGAVVVVVYLAVPVLAMYFLSLRKPMYNPKFLLLAVPAFALVLGIGLETIRRVGESWLASVGLPRPAGAMWSVCAVAVAVGLVAYPTSYSLAAMYFDPKFARDDYRSLAASIVARSGPGDAIILNAPGQVDIFRYYFRGDVAIHPLPRQRPVDSEATRNELARIVGQYQRVWLVLWAAAESDPDNIVEHWLDENGFKVDNRWFGGPRLVEYSLAADPVTKVTAAVSFQDGVRLNDYAILTPVVEAGQTINLNLTWEAQRKVEGRYSVFVHVIDDKELLWGQMDGEPVGGSVPTSTWAPSAVVVDRRGIQVLPGTPPGKYRLELGMYRSDTGQRLAILGADGKPAADRYLFGSLQVAPAKTRPGAEALRIPRPVSAVFGNVIKLLGFGLNPLGRDSDGAVFLGQDVAHLTLLWQSRAPAMGDLSTRVDVRNQAGRVVATEQQTITLGRFPTNLWTEGDVIRDQLKIPLNGLASGEYAVLLGVLDRDGNPLEVVSGVHADGAAVNLGSMSVK